MQVRAKIALFRLAFDSSHHFVADHQAANIAPFRLFYKFLHQNVRVKAAKGVNNAFRRLARLRQHHADALRALYQLHHQRRAAHHIDQIAGVVGRMGEAGDRHINSLSRQQLQRTQLVARAGDRHRFVQRVAAAQLELAQHRGAVKGDS